MPYERQAAIAQLKVTAPADVTKAPHKGYYSSDRRFTLPLGRSFVQRTDSAQQPASSTQLFA